MTWERRAGRNMTQTKSERSVVIHEDLSRQEEVRPSSDRSFGLVFAAFFVLVAIAPLLRRHSARPWALVVAAVFFTISLARPGVLQPLNRLWLELGRVLQRVTNPIAMGLLFLSTIVPISFFMRLAKRDPLRLCWDRNARSYWIDRTPPGPQAGSMKDQF